MSLSSSPTELSTQCKSGLLRLPNDILHNFLYFLFLPCPLRKQSFTSPFSKWLSADEQDTPISASQPLQYDFQGKDAEFLHTLCAVRGVSRRIRELCDQLSFWCDPTFDLLDLSFRRTWRYPSLFWQVEVKARDDRDESFIKTFFSDKGLGSRVGQRTMWNFRSLKSLVALGETVPGFYQNVTEVRLALFKVLKASGGYNQTESGIKSSIDTAVGELGKCRRLTSLVLGFNQSILNLNLISESCPWIETIRLEDVLLSTNAHYHGNLNGLCCLREVCLPIIQSLNENVFVSPSTFVLPHDSATTLRSLQLVGQIQYSMERLNMFVNLTSLTIRPITRLVCEFIFDVATFPSLRLFSTGISTFNVIAATEIADMLSASCLRDLHTFQFEVFGDEYYDSCYDDGSFPDISLDFDPAFHLARLWPLLEGVTTHLSSLKHLKFRSILDPSWAQSFTRLRELKSIGWVIPYEQTWLWGRNGHDDMVANAEFAFSNAFACVAEPPSIQIQTLSCYDSSSVWRTEMNMDLEVDEFEPRLGFNTEMDFFDRGYSMGSDYEF